MLKFRLLVLIYASFYAQGLMASSFGLGVQAGLIATPIPGSGAGFFYSSDRYTLGLSYAQGALDFKSVLAAEEDSTSSVRITDAKASVSLAMVEARLFLFWGFNISFGLGQRTIGLDMEVQESVTDSTLRSELVSKSNVMNFGLGVMGRWSWFYLGLDIFGLTQASSGSTSVETTGTGLMADNEDLVDLSTDLVDLGKNLGESPTLQLMNVRIGMMF
jgi:hypothetical protein